MITRLAQWWIDRHARAPRGLGFSIDEGLPDRGIRYGGAQTIHNTGTIDIVVEKDAITEVWFRCRELPYRIDNRTTGVTTAGRGRGSIVAVEFAPDVLP